VSTQVSTRVSSIMPRKRPTSKERTKSTQYKRYKKNRKPEDKPVKLGVSEANRTNPGSNGNQGSDNLVSQESEPVSASDGANRTARARNQARALAPHVVSTNSSEEDTLQPMEVTPAKVVHQGSEPLTASDVANRTASVRERRSLARQVTSTSSDVNDTVQPMEVILAPVSNTWDWSKLVRTYEAEIAQRADNVCISCGGLFYHSAVSAFNMHMIADKCGGGFLANVTPASAATTPSNQAKSQSCAFPTVPFLRAVYFMSVVLNFNSRFFIVGTILVGFFFYFVGPYTLWALSLWALFMWALWRATGVRFPPHKVVWFRTVKGCLSQRCFRQIRMVKVYERTWSKIFSLKILEWISIDKKSSNFFWMLFISFYAWLLTL